MRILDAVAKTDTWPIAKRAALLWLGFALPLSFMSWAAGRLAFSTSDRIDLHLWDVVFGIAVCGTFVVGMAAVVLTRLAADGRWFAAASVVIYPLLYLPFVYSTGFTSSSVLLFEGPVVLAIVFYDDLRIATVAAFSNLSAFVGLGIVTSIGALPYAPLFLDRNIDTLGSGALVLGMGAPLAAVVVTCMAMCVLILARFKRARSERDAAVALISRYVPAEVASGILSGATAPHDGHKRQRVTSFFSDIVGFTEMAEELEPEDMATVLNEYFTEMAAIAAKHRGTIDELQGDGLILVFGAPEHRSDAQHALDAVRCAEEMQARIPELNARWSHAGIDARVHVRIGINTGVVTVGHFGSGGRLKYTVLGKHVNLAARVQAMCQPGQVLISHGTWLLVQADVAAKSLGEHPFKGITRPVEVHQLTIGIPS